MDACKLGVPTLGPAVAVCLHPSQKGINFHKL